MNHVVREECREVVGEDERRCVAGIRFAAGPGVTGTEVALWIILREISVRERFSSFPARGVACAGGKRAPIRLSAHCVAGADGDQWSWSGYVFRYRGSSVCEGFTGEPAHVGCGNYGLHVGFSLPAGGAAEDPCLMLALTSERRKKPLSSGWGCFQSYKGRNQMSRVRGIFNANPCVEGSFHMQYNL